MLVFVIKGRKSYLASAFNTCCMKRILSEQNIAAFLFVLALIVFSFAHEGTKKIDPAYQANRLKIVKETSDVLTVVQKESASYNQ